MEVITASDTDITLVNKDRVITLARDTTVDIMSQLKFRVADSDVVRYYPMVIVTTPGMYEIRGTVASGTGQQSWNASNFAAFWYDLKANLKTESLQITAPIVFRDILANTLWYNTSSVSRTLKVYQNGYSSTELLNAFPSGQYQIVGWQGQPYVAVKSKANKLSKLIIEHGNATDEKKTLTVGETWDIGDGWTITAQSIDAKASPRQVWLVLSKDGIKLDDKVLAQGQIYVYTEKSLAGETDVPLFVTYIDSVFAGATSDMVQLRYTWAIGTSVTEVKSADKFGNMEVQTADDDYIKLYNKDRTISLSKDTTVDIFGELKFKVADNETLRYYPFVNYEIYPPLQPPQPFDTLRFEPSSWNLVSTPKTLNYSAVDIAFDSLNLDTNNVKWYFNATINAWEHPSSIMPLRGYWLYNNASYQVFQKLNFKNMAGPNLPPSMLLKAGWNLIGHTSTQAMPVSSALISIDGKYSHLLTYDPIKGWRFYIVGNPSLQQFDAFEHGRGYWIFMTQDATYAAVDV